MAYVGMRHMAKKDRKESIGSQIAREADQKAPKMNRGILARGRVALTTVKFLVSTSSPPRINVDRATTFTLYPNVNKITFYYYHHKTHQLYNPLIMSQMGSSGAVSASVSVSAGISGTVPLENRGDGTAFPLSSSSVLKINKGDITQWFVDGSSDAIVNPANEGMLGGAGADGAIHKAAGPELRDACYNVPEVRPGIRCPTGEARITPGFNLPSSHVIYTVGPIYDFDANPEASLRNAYRNSLIVAKDNNIKYIAFPALSCGVHRYPYDEAATVAITTVKEFANDLKEVHFVLFSDEIYNVWLKKAQELLQA